MSNNTNSQRQNTLSEIITHFDDLKNTSNAKILETAMQLLMNAERTTHINTHPEDKANGYYDRTIGSPLGDLNFKVPRDRNGDFRPQVLPGPYARDLEDRIEFLKALIGSYYSPSDIAAILPQVGLHYSSNEIEKLKNNYLLEYEAWAQRQLPHDCIALFIDAYHSEIQINGKVKKTASYSVIGFDFNGFKDLYGVYIQNGNESKEYWLTVLNNLIERGLKRTLYIITDDFPGLKEAVPTLFPNALHQLCYIHMQRNVHRNMSKPDAKECNQALSQIRVTTLYDEALNAFSTTVNKYKDKYPHFVKALEEKKSHYLAFTQLPQDVRKYFYTTNTVESFNSILEKLRQNHGGFFQSQDTLKINVYIAYQKLKNKKWRKGMPHIINNLYIFRQLFAQKYSEQPKEKM